MDFEHHFTLTYIQRHICYANMLLTSETHPNMFKTDQWVIIDAIKWVSQINKLRQISPHSVLDPNAKKS